MQYFITGQLAITNNSEVCFQFTMNGYKVITLSDNGTGDVRLYPSNNPNVIDGLALLPPVEAYWAEVDGNREVFENIYANHLDTTASDYLAVVLQSLHLGISLIIYYPGDIYDAVPSFLSSYINKVFGIWMATDNNNYFVDNNYLPFWLQFLYNKNMINEVEFIRSMPLQILNSLPQDFLDVIMIGLGVPGRTLEEQRHYMREYIQTPHYEIPFERI